MPNPTPRATPDLIAQLELARHLASLARPVILKHYSPAGARYEIKGDGSPVTIADRSAEELIRKELARRCPSDSILGEEFGEHRGTSDVRWVLDPVDGTRAFTHGVPLFGSMIAVEVRDASEPGGWHAIVGVVDFPALDETCHAHLGRGAVHEIKGEPRPARVSQVGTLADAVITMSTPRTPGQVLAKNRADLAGASKLETMERMLAAARDVRGWGDCHAHMMVATGRLEAMVNGKIARWDVAPLEPIVHEAGGRITDWRGQPAGDGGLGAVTSNTRIHAALVAALAGA